MRDFRTWGDAPVVAAFFLTWGMTTVAAAQTAPPNVPATATAAPSQPSPASGAPAQPAAPAQPGAPAQPAAPAQPPPGYASQYPPPPPGYAYQYPPPPPPGYGYPAYAYQRRPPAIVPYTGGSIPQGYHLEERPRNGLIISGALVTGIPWAIGLAGVSSANFPNSSGWLVVPALGPWLTLAARHDSSCNNSSDVCFDDGLNALARTALVFDGLVQTAGAVLFIIGVSSKKQVLARDFTGHLQLTPAPIGRQGAGAFLSGDF